MEMTHSGPSLSARYPKVVNAHKVQSHLVEGYPCEITDQIVPARPQVPEVFRRRSHRGAKTNPVASYVRAVKSLGLTDPTDATAHYARSRHLGSVRLGEIDRHARVKPSAVAALAHGEAGLGDLEVQMVDVEQAKRERRAKRDALRNAADQAFALAVDAIHEAGEQTIVDLFAPVVGHALTDALNLAEHERWATAHRALYRLRTGGLLPHAEGATLDEYTFARPDLVHAWRIDRASELRTTGYEATAHDVDGRPTSRRFSRPNTPPPNLYEIAGHADAWRPGVHTAAQVITNAETFAPRTLTAAGVAA